MTGEFELIEEIRRRAERAGAASSEQLWLGSGDDAAIAVPGGATATSVDAIVDGVHFESAVWKPAQIGAKALAVALSDLAAMGAEAGEAYVQLGLPGGYGAERALGVADGLIELAAATGTALAGGDVVASPVLFVAVTVVGHASSADALVARSGAQAGDAVAVTGELGGAAAGLALISNPGRATAAGAAAGALRRRQFAPRPLLDAGRALAGAGASAMIDVSDGLGADASRIAEASGVGIELDADSIPIAAGVADVARATGSDPIELALGGGEDYELLIAIGEERLGNAETAARSGGFALSVIGRVRAGAGARLSGPDGRDLASDGYDQLRPPSSGGRT